MRPFVSLVFVLYAWLAAKRNRNRLAIEPEVTKYILSVIKTNIITQKIIFFFKHKIDCCTARLGA